MDARDDVVLAPARTTRWQEVSDRLAHYSWYVLLAATVLALVGGIVSAAAEPPDAAVPKANVDECLDPPCFGAGDMPGVQDLPVVVPTLGYLLAIVLGLPSLFAGGWNILRRRWRMGGRRLLVFVGPVLFLAGTEIVPHLLSPCLPAALGAEWLPPVCERTEQHGVDVADRWHTLDHALVGALLMAALYWLVLRRWRPDVVRFR